MSIEVTFRNIKPREEVRRRAEALYGKLAKFLDQSADGRVIITAEHGASIVELLVNAHGQTHRSIEEDDDLRTSLDRAFHTMETSLRRSKERRQDRTRRSRGAVEDGFESADSE
ncbi:MAG: HPF/RaiA family ribosome-associated protein [Myxococcota bacterium]